jgi:hypothetical protein
MRGLERVPPGHGDIGNSTARRLIFEVGRTIEQPEIGLIEEFGEFRGRDQPAAVPHVRYLTFNCEIFVQYSGHGFPGYFFAKALLRAEMAGISC